MPERCQFALILVNSYSFFGQFVIIKFFFGQFVLIWSIRTQFGQFVIVYVNSFSHLFRRKYWQKTKKKTPKYNRNEILHLRCDTIKIISFFIQFKKEKLSEILQAVWCHILWSYLILHINLLNLSWIKMSILEEYGAFKNRQNKRNYSIWICIRMELICKF